MRLVMNQVAETLIRVSCVNQEDMCALFIILSDKMVGEERLAGT